MLALLLASVVRIPAPVALAATIIVNSTADTTVAGDGQCTLREAIINANSNSDTTSGDCITGSGTDNIHFNLAGTPPFTIGVTSALPQITDPAPVVQADPLNTSSR